MNTISPAVRTELRDHVAQVILARPRKANALDVAGWHALRDVFRALDERDDVRVAILKGEGAHFCAGIDLAVLKDLRGQSRATTGSDSRNRERLWQWIVGLQGCVNAIEHCRHPVIAALHGVCYGGGVDIACACDLRYATRDARLCVKEVDMAVTADLGVLQRLPKLVGDGRARELAFSAREFNGEEAERMGLVSGVFDSVNELHQGVQAIAENLATKAPQALHGTKRALLFARDARVADGLKQVADWNAAALLSQDVSEAMAVALGARAR